MSMLAISKEKNSNPTQNESRSSSLAANLQPIDSVITKLAEKSFQNGLSVSLPLLKKYAENMKSSSKGKELVVLVGITGVGKSTLINYMLGCKILRTKPILGRTLADCRDGKAFTSDRAVSGTQHPDLYIVNSKEKKYLFCDTPGFYDTTGARTRIEQTITTKAVLDHASELKILCLLQPDYFQLRSRQLTEACNALSGLFPNFESHAESILFLVTHSEDTVITEKEICDAAEKILNEKGREENKNEKAVLSMITKYPGHVLLAKIFDGGVFKDSLSVKLEEVKPLCNLNSNVGCFIEPRDREPLKKTIIDGVLESFKEGKDLRSYFHELKKGFGDNEQIARFFLREEIDFKYLGKRNALQLLDNVEDEINKLLAQIKGSDDFQVIDGYMNLLKDLEKVDREQVTKALSEVKKLKDEKIGFYQSLAINSLNTNDWGNFASHLSKLIALDGQDRSKYEAIIQKTKEKVDLLKKQATDQWNSNPNTALNNLERLSKGLGNFQDVSSHAIQMYIEALEKVK